MIWLEESRWTVESRRERKEIGRGDTSRDSCGILRGAPHEYNSNIILVDYFMIQFKLRHITSWAMSKLLDNCIKADGYDVDQWSWSTNKLTRWLMWRPAERWKYHRTDIVGLPLCQKISPLQGKQSRAWQGWLAAQDPTLTLSNTRQSRYTKLVDQSIMIELWRHTHQQL